MLSENEPSYDAGDTFLFPSFKSIFINVEKNVLNSYCVKIISRYLMSVRTKVRNLGLTAEFQAERWRLSAGEDRELRLSRSSIKPVADYRR